MMSNLQPIRNKVRVHRGFTLIEVMIAGLILVIASVGVLAMISVAIGSNNRNKHDSTKTMLGGAIIEQVQSTLIGSGSATLTDCAGTSFDISADAGGARLNAGSAHPNDTLGSDIDFNESSPPASYHMDYVITSPCATGGLYVATYDVRWHIDQIGAAGGTPTSSFLVTIGARMKGSGTQNGVYFSPPINMRTVIGRPE
jgi:type II secretory pathway pseudopilin PulG